MPRYHFVRDKSGNTRLVPVTGEDIEGFTKPKAPAIPEVGADTISVHRCTECGQDFSIVALMAKHFNKDHKDLYENKDSWRPYHEEVVIG